MRVRRSNDDDVVKSKTKLLSWLVNFNFCFSHSCLTGYVDISSYNRRILLLASYSTITEIQLCAKTRSHSIANNAPASHRHWWAKKNCTLCSIRYTKVRRLWSSRTFFYASDIATLIRFYGLDDLLCFRKTFKKPTNLDLKHHIRNFTTTPGHFEI